MAMRRRIHLTLALTAGSLLLSGTAVFGPGSRAVAQEIRNPGAAIEEFLSKGATAFSEGAKDPKARDRQDATSANQGPVGARRKGSQRPAAQPKEAKQPEAPPRPVYSATEAMAAAIPGIPDARFWGDSEPDFQKALPTVKGPWLSLSSGGADGAFGAGVLVGLSEAGKRPEFSMVSGVSTGALMAPFVFVGKKYDTHLRSAYTTIFAGDVFELGPKGGESFFDTWPLRDLIAKQVTPELLVDVAAEHAKGRRLIVVTTDIDSERPVVWNMGAIAASGGDKALKLFRQVLLAAVGIPGAFPPVLIDVEAQGKQFNEMHADGGMCAQFYVAPEALLAPTSKYKLPADGLYVIINTQLTPDFGVTERNLLPIMIRGISVIVKTLTRSMVQQTYVAAKQSGVAFSLATIPTTFTEPARGAFDTEYMKSLFNVGFEQGKKGTAFVSEPPAAWIRPSPASR